jgi:hypothetical protein
MNEQRWFIVLSPDGAAHAASVQIARAFAQTLHERCNTFTYRQAFSRMIAHGDDTLVADLLNQSMAVSCLDFQTTHLLVTALAPITVFTLNLLRKYRISTVHWFYEDFRRAPYWSDVAPGYDHFCAIQRGPIELLCKKLCARYHYLPTAYDAAEPESAPVDRSDDIAFIGIPSRYRIAALEKMASAGFSLSIAGVGWKSYRGILEKHIRNGGWINTTDSFRLLKRAKIGINLSVDEPKEPEHTHISPRVYDICAAGCLLVSEEVPLLAASLPDCSYYTFDAIDRAVETIKRLLDDFGSYTTVRDKNRAAVLANHTYRNRVEQLIGMVGQGVQQP